MKTQNKILLGVGILALGYYFYIINKNKKLSNQQTTEPNNPITPTNPNNGGVVPTIPNEKRTIRDGATFEFIKDFQSDPNQATTRMISWNFKKGQKIKGVPDYSNCSMGGGVCPLLTTTKGELQSKQNQMYWITIPQGYLKLAS